MASTPQKAPYGTWKSPISADVLVQKSVIYEAIIVDNVTREIYHIERRPTEAGRSVLVESRGQTDLVDKEAQVRTGVHEYGGGAATVSNGIAYFSNYKDGRVYRTERGKSAHPVTPENANWRYADFIVAPTNSNILVAVLEDHTRPDPSTVVNKLVAVDISSQVVQTIAEGADFYSSPRISPDGKFISWIQWYHPDMPWVGSELIVGQVNYSGSLFKVQNPTVVSGLRGQISVSQPEWASNDTLLFLNDSSGFLNPWSYSPTSVKAGPIFAEPIVEDFADPAWLFGKCNYAILDQHTILFSSIRDGKSVFSFADLRSHTLKPVLSPYIDISDLRAISAQSAVFIGKKADEGAAIIQVTLSASGEPAYAPVKPQSDDQLPRDIVSKAVPYPLSIPPSNEPVHVLYYAPFNPHFSPLDGETPPAVISIHGGPTARSTPGLDWGKQFWTSRGWAWVDVNYGGSSGYGKKYRDRLCGKWGIVDVEDAVEAVNQLGKLRLIDPKRTAIRGGSAGGYTALAAVVNKPPVFQAATSLYGVSDLIKLAEHTHKFELRYGDMLIGGTPQEIPEVYKERSPITHADRIKAPLLILQGSIDAVVPPSQAEEIVAKIKQKGGRVKYILFEGEGHGWRKADNIKRGLEEELAWYKDVFGLTNLKGPDAAL